MISYRIHWVNTQLSKLREILDIVKHFDRIHIPFARKNNTYGMGFLIARSEFLLNATVF